ncbi:hypothetical protein [Natrarchaeobius chitinivorans]|uniref:Uncharacterized protein n=1 Tax=Natrarchaeobius chitinivorans TaxID=1679083 RepID=A0A3N6M3F2_NATCH|nr:hypothetical protein [Natrarchaeobius chitinivorans]RQG90410.1 hypothetical protein EA473_21320 [Natrarchaeobius chitinivorans]
MSQKRGHRAIRRRTLLSAVGSAAGLSATGTAAGNPFESADDQRRCPEATIRPDMAPCSGASTDGCADDDPETIELREQARERIETQYATVGDLIDRDFVPYFDVKRPGGSSGWSHWLNPEYIGDDSMLDPAHPESILVDNESLRPIGIMFIATVDGDSVDPPPPVYTRETEGEDETDEEERRCSPWHYHRGFPGRFAWKFYRQVYERDYEDRELSVPCRTPCMMHVWTVPHPEGVYAHDAPPAEYRRGPSANDPGFETHVDPDERQLGWETLPDAVVPDLRPRDVLGLW